MPTHRKLERLKDGALTEYATVNGYRVDVAGYAQERVKVSYSVTDTHIRLYVEGERVDKYFEFTLAAWVAMFGQPPEL